MQIFITTHEVMTIRRRPLLRLIEPINKAKNAKDTQHFHI